MGCVAAPLACTHKMPVAILLQLRQLKISPDIVKCFLVGKITLAENHVEMQVNMLERSKKQDQESKSPLFGFGQVAFHLGLRFPHFKK